jgi:sulfite exporter TauE/SafE
VLEGALLMVAFGAGTMPAMLALGTARVLAGPRLRAQLARTAGILVVVFGLVTLARGLWPEAGHLHPGHHH